GFPVAAADGGAAGDGSQRRRGIECCGQHSVGHVSVEIRAKVSGGQRLSIGGGAVGGNERVADAATDGGASPRASDHGAVDISAAQIHLISRRVGRQGGIGLTFEQIVSARGGLG